ncbi:MAG: TIGR03862 family flavoprotein [Microvirga sp.]
MAHAPPIRTVAIVGAGPAGLMAAEALAVAGVAVTVHERMPSVGRKFLMAGRGGLNLTHNEDFPRFLARYREAEAALRPALEALRPRDLRAWCEGLGQETFVGTSGRIFPASLKASPLLRAWLARLDRLGVRFVLRHRWQGFDEDGRLVFETPSGATDAVAADAALLALGGASWPRLGSDGAWTAILAGEGIALAPFRPANVGFTLAWSDWMRDRFEGQPLKRIALTFGGRSVRGEAVLTAGGLEGGAIYALSAELRDAIARDGSARLEIDLRPDLTREALAARLGAPRQSQSTSTFLRKAAGLSPLSIALLRESMVALPVEPSALAGLVKAVPIILTGVASIERAISSAGGVPFSALDETLMLRGRPGVFVAGEMLDWEAPTGGYLLQATFSTAVAAAHGVLRRLADG